MLLGSPLLELPRCFTGIVVRISIVRRTLLSRVTLLVGLVPLANQFSLEQARSLVINHMHRANNLDSQFTRDGGLGKSDPTLRVRERARDRTTNECPRRERHSCCKVNNANTG